MNENYLSLTLDEGLGEELSNPFLAYGLFIRIEIIQISFAVDADNKRGYYEQCTAGTHSQQQINNSGLT